MKRQLQIQGSRPPPLSVSKDSHKIKKPPKPPAPPHQRPPEPADPPAPIVIYAVSPKIVHATVANFMTIVQRLTGLSSSDFSGSGDISPAARLAATEKASPRERAPCNTEGVVDIVEAGGIELGVVPGILSPAPETLPPIPAGIFSPVYEPSIQLFHGSSFVGSPSGLLSGPIVSPTLSPDFFGYFWDF